MLKAESHGKKYITCPFILAYNFPEFTKVWVVHEFREVVELLF